MILTGAQILMEVLAAQGADIVFGYPGGQVVNIYDELYKNAHRIRHILTAHEQGAAHAADAYARVSGKTGVVIATSGPGATNLVTGIANAYLDSVPMVAITGNVSAHLLGRDTFQEVDIVGITQPIVKHSFIVKNVKKLEKTLNEAFLIASTGRKGPVLVDIPKNVQAEACEYAGKPASIKKHHPKPHNDLKRAIEAIKKSKKPYIYCGGGVVASGAEQEALELSKRLSAPVGLSMMGLTAIAHSYELNLGMCGMHGRYAASKAQSEADLLIAIGVRFSDRATGNVNEYGNKAAIIHVDIDEAEMGKNVTPKIELCGDMKEILRALLEKLPAMQNSEWLEQINAYKKEGKQPHSEDMTPKNIIRTVHSYCSGDTIVATDVGQHQMWVMQYYPFEQPRTLVTSGGLGTMGYGLGAAIGACVASGGQRTVLFTSEGSFGMNLTELATAVTENLPITIVILNNNVLGMVRQWQSMFFEERYSQTTLTRKTDFPRLAEAFGAHGYAAESLAQLKAILSDLPDGPCVISCPIDKDEKVLPMIPPGGSIKDIVIRD